MISSIITSPQLRQIRRSFSTYVMRDRNSRIDFYHCVTDPHSHLALQALIRLLRRYEGILEVDLYVLTHAKESGLDAYATSLEDQLEWAYGDARLLEGAYRDLGLRFSPSSNAPPNENLVKTCNATAIDLLDASFGKGGAEYGCWTIAGRGAQSALVFQTLEKLVKIGDMAFNNDASGINALPSSSSWTSAMEQRTRAAARRLDRKGHYLTAMTRYGYEWFWGVDRLHYLEVQLNERFGITLSPIVEFDRTTKLRLLRLPGHRDAKEARPKLKVELVYSFRSPYSQLCLKRLFRMCDWYGVELKISPVLPMVMRGFVVNLNKRLYILLDAKREAETHGLNFGKIVDPVGAGVERTFAVYDEILHRRKIQRQREFLLAFAECVWGEGIDVAKDEGILTVVRRSGIKETEMSDGEVIACLSKPPSWREFEAENRANLYAGLKLWGVPSFRLTRVVAGGKFVIYVIKDSRIWNWNWDSRFECFAYSLRATTDENRVAEEPVFTAWGQDRLFALESAILKEMGESRSSL